MQRLCQVYKGRRLKSGESAQFFFEKMRGRNAFLLESSQVGPDSRFSYIGVDPFLICRYEGGVLSLDWRRKFSRSDRNIKKKVTEREALEQVQKLFQKFKVSQRSTVPFGMGAAGYFSYDFGVRLAGISQIAHDEQRIPDFVLLFVDQLIAIDHAKREVYCMGMGPDRKQAEARLESLRQKIEVRAPAHTPVSPGEKTTLKQHWSQQDYRRKIDKIRTLIREGETYQVNFSQRFEAGFEDDPWNLYRRLSSRNPVPFSCYFEFDDFQLISLSPELLLRKRGRILETWPIKGTVKRGRDGREDRKNVTRLLASKKDEAELAMITDLARNDIGRVSEAGSVKVLAEREIQKYRHVIHTVARVSGKLRRGLDFFDAFRALFPGGSITGCPKRRTMEIIDRLEGVGRGVYTGSAGFIAFNGDADLNILIRSSVVRDGKIYFSAGGGIVYDSDPESEYEEVLMKARGFLEQIGPNSLSTSGSKPVN